MMRERKADVRAMFNSSYRDKAKTQLRKTDEKYDGRAYKLADWLEGKLPYGLPVFSCPEEHRRRISTVNRLQRVCLEIHRRTRDVRIFPNEASCLKLVCAMLMEISETWETGRVYLLFERY